MYSESDIKKLFLKIRNYSFKDLGKSCNIRFEKMGFTGYSSPFTGDVYINLEKVNAEKISKDAVIGTIAHELAHQVSYKKRSFIKKWLFLWNYYLSDKKRRKIELEADIIAIERGYGKEILEETKASFARYNKIEKLAKLKKVYPSPAEIRQLLKNK